MFENNAASFRVGKKIWWNSFSGPFKTLHEITPPRVQFILEEVKNHFRNKVFNDISVLDAGCGAGIVSIPLAKKGMNVLGVDESLEAIEAAINKSQDLKNANYISSSFEDFSRETQETFDLVICMDVVEHVDNPSTFVAALCKLLRPGGMIIVSTISKTIKSALVAILLAEYVLKAVPKGTHQHDKFITPEVLASMFAASGMQFRTLKGIEYSVLNGCWELGSDTSVNYIASVTDPLIY